MEVKFDLVRIGKFRKNNIAEKIISQNLKIFRDDIRSLLKDKKSFYKNNKLNIVMIIPAKGYNIKISLEDISDEQIKKDLMYNFPNSIFKGKYSILLNNL